MARGFALDDGAGGRGGVYRTDSREDPGVGPGEPGREGGSADGDSEKGQHLRHGGAELRAGHGPDDQHDESGDGEPHGGDFQEVAAARAQVDEGFDDSGATPAVAGDARHARAGQAEHRRRYRNGRQDAERRTGSGLGRLSDWSFGAEAGWSSGIASNAHDQAQTAEGQGQYEQKADGHGCAGQESGHDGVARARPGRRGPD